MKPPPEFVGTNTTYRNCALSYPDIAARAGQDPMTISREWNRWVQDCNTKHRAGSQRPSIINNRENRHVTRIASMDRAAT
ncbi:HTH_Tnp_Tc3_2 domain-containing protein [Trichonephila clavipes]|nr:HTH_Tnp_Tc3_2 domain-containing protein [Trichonephila clavipes]